jgi:VWFA-related protein
MFKLCRSGMGKLLRVAVFAMLIALTGSPTPEQGKSSDHPDPDEYRISVDVGLVVLPVIVTNRKGKAVSGLGEGSFHVFDNGRPQQITFFEPEDVPVTVGLVIDNSGSMGAKRPEVVAATEEFAKSSNPHDEMFIVNFNQWVSMGLPKGVPFTSDLQQLQNAASRTPAYGNTALYDGLAAALEHLQMGTASRKALIVITDGGDNASRLSFHELLKRAETSSAQIYTLGVFDKNYSGEDPSVLKRLAKVTGGKAYFPQSASQITGICQGIARDLRDQYTLGYHPSSRTSGKYHAIRVTAKAIGEGRLHVSTRAGYLISSEPQAALPAPAKADL